MARLGGSVLQINESTSSAVKGETLSDSVKALQSYADVLVLRHSVAGSAATASRALDIPFLNAGDGVGEHPTQALLDAFTILSELGKINGLTITMVGDLRNGRTVHSLSKLLSLFDVKLNFVSPPELGMPSDVLDVLRAKGIPMHSHTSFNDGSLDVVAETDVLYVTRVQKERFTNHADYERLKHVYIITPETLRSAKERMIVMHPLPRVGEIAEEVDLDPRAAYFRQMRAGLYVRMALLALVCGVPPEIVAREASA